MKRRMLGSLNVSAIALGAPVSAAELRKGAVVQVKPNAIWFEEAKNLTRWQDLKTAGDAAALDEREHARRSLLPALPAGPRSEACTLNSAAGGGRTSRRGRHGQGVVLRQRRQR